MKELYEKDEAFDHFGYRQTNRLRISCSHEIEYIGSDDMIGTIAAIIFFIIVIGFCCCSDDGSSSNSTTRRNVSSTQTANRRNSYSGGYSYCECPSCGAPYYDGYCEECGYPDVNQGWLGENY